jgi:hypothetical protein
MYSHYAIYPATNQISDNNQLSECMSIFMCLIKWEEPQRNMGLVIIFALIIASHICYNNITLALNVCPPVLYTWNCNGRAAVVAQRQCMFELYVNVEAVWLSNYMHEIMVARTSWFSIVTTICYQGKGFWKSTSRNYVEAANIKFEKIVRVKTDLNPKYHIPKKVK